MNTVSYPSQTAADLRIEASRAKAMKKTDKLLRRLGFKRIEWRNNLAYTMPEYPGPVLNVPEPLGTVQEVLTAVFAWGHEVGRARLCEEIRNSLGFDITSRS